MGYGHCFGTFGELLQGALPERSRDFLVTLPITLRSTARFSALPGQQGVIVHPPHKEKSRLLAERLLHSFGIRAGGVLCLESELPEAKGLASSSADMVATALAIRSTLGLTVSRALLAELMGIIEPTDGVMYDGIVSFYQREGALRSFLGILPSLTVVALDEGGRVETMELHKHCGSYSASRLAEYENLLLDLERAVRRRNLASLGEVATRSAILNQDVVPKMHLELFLDLRARHDALGVVATHSGTHLGMLLDPASPRYLETLSALVDELARHRPGLRIYRTCGSEDRR